jgi:hypothetical protein
MKYKGKTKSQLKEILEDKSNETENEVEVDIQKKSVKKLKDMCVKKGLSKVGNKDELRKRLESVEDGSEKGIRVVKWKKKRWKGSHQTFRNCNGWDIDVMVET